MSVGSCHYHNTAVEESSEESLENHCICNVCYLCKEGGEGGGERGGMGKRRRRRRKKEDVEGWIKEKYHNLKHKLD